MLIGAVVGPSWRLKAHCGDAMHHGANIARLRSGRLLLLVTLLLGVSRQAAAIETDRPPDFDEQVRPILAARCHACHGERERKGELDLRSRASILRGGESGPVIHRDRPGDSPLVEKITSGEMPPKGEERLSAHELD
jgi:Planctomycete cytochrome C